MSMAVKYAMNKRRKMAEGGCTSSATVDPQKAADATASMRKAFGYAKGGLVDRIMDKRGAKPMADGESADFDYMDERSAGDAADYTDANSGDELGDAMVEDDDRDMVSRIMRSRSKKDRMPRPA